MGRKAKKARKQMDTTSDAAFINGKYFVYYILGYLGYFYTYLMKSTKQGDNSRK